MPESPSHPLKQFGGFPAGKVRLISIPNLVFTELLPLIDNLNELKVTLYGIWFAEQMEGAFRPIRAGDFQSDRRFFASLGATTEEALAALQDGLDRAVARGTLLHAEGTSVYFINSPRGRAAAAALKSGDWSPDDTPQPTVTLEDERPNIFKLYEEHIGPLTPMIAEALREAEQTYPGEWIVDAVRIAVENNVRRWRYVEAILRSWQEEGRDEPNRGNAQKNSRKYVEGEFADYIEH